MSLDLEAIIAELVTAYGRATPGVWATEREDLEYGAMYWAIVSTYDRQLQLIARTEDDEDSKLARFDGELIVLTHERLPALLAALREARAETDTAWAAYHSEQAAKSHAQVLLTHREEEIVELEASRDALDVKLSRIGGAVIDAGVRDVPADDIEGCIRALAAERDAALAFVRKWNGGGLDGHVARGIFHEEARALLAATGGEGVKP